MSSKKKKTSSTKPTSSKKPTPKTPPVLLKVAPKPDNFVMLMIGKSKFANIVLQDKQGVSNGSQEKETSPKNL